MKLERIETEIAGCLRLVGPRSSDIRGTFNKLLHHDAFAEYGLSTDFREIYYSTSARNVVRGLHFQTPPHDHVKLVTCLHGAVFDVVVDLRRESPTYGKHVSFELTEDSADMIYIPPGLAHGFCARSDNAGLLYLVSTVYAPDNDTGIAWDSAGISWPLDGPATVSDRDKSFLSFDEFETPF